MEIMQVTGSLVCSQRVAGLNHSNLRILRNNKGKLSVAVDPVGASPGNWVFTANLIHGPMQEVGREMSYINQRLLPADRPEAEKRASALKTAFAQLDEAAKLQDGDKLRKAYIKVASGFGLYAQVLPAQVQQDLKQA